MTQVYGRFRIISGTEDVARKVPEELVTKINSMHVQEEDLDSPWIITTTNNDSYLAWNGTGLSEPYFWAKHIVQTLRDEKFVVLGEITWLGEEINDNFVLTIEDSIVDYSPIRIRTTW